MYEIIEQPFESYSEYKKSMDAAVGATVQNIVKIGYYLKLARDTGILKESGYTTMKDFAQAEYNIDASSASRFIGINDRYSVGGNSLEISHKYRGFETSKLVEMLTIPDSITEELSPEMKREEIREIKSQLKEEEKTSDIEILIERSASVEMGFSDLYEVLKQTLEVDFDMYSELHKLFQTEKTLEQLYSTLAPAGYASMIGRIPGKGRKMLCIKNESDTPTMIDIRTGEKEECTWEQIQKELENMIIGDTPEEAYRNLYGRPPRREEKKPSAVRVSTQAKPEEAKKTEKQEKTYTEPQKSAQNSIKPYEEQEKTEQNEEKPHKEALNAPAVEEKTEIAPAQLEKREENRKSIEAAVEQDKAESEELSSTQKDLLAVLTSIATYIKKREYQSASYLADDITRRLKHLAI